MSELRREDGLFGGVIAELCAEIMSRQADCTLRFNKKEEELILVTPSGEEMVAGEFSTYSPTRILMETLEDFLVFET